jgi:inosine-uridine nucleoside N-ribohydrolase
MRPLRKTTAILKTLWERLGLGAGVLAVLLLFSPSGATAAAAAPAKIPVLLDTDIGDDIDDAFALALALTSPELDLRGVTTVHGDSFTRALIACRLLHAVGRDDIPVASGQPAREPPDLGGQFQYGLRPCFRKRPEREGAVQFLYRQLKDHPGELTLLTVGPLTNVAELFRRHPDCKPWIKRVVLMGGAVRVGYEDKPPPVAEWNVKSDVKAAREVFAAGVPLVVAPLDATTNLKLEAPLRRRIFGAGTPLTHQLHALYQLWGHPTPTLFDPVAVTLCFEERFCKLEDLRLAVDDNGLTLVTSGKPNARVATAIRRDEYLRWYVERVAPAGTAAAAARPAPRNVSAPVARGGMPNRVHVIEDYETDIERRWWLCGLPETKNVPPDGKRACRGVLTNDFDDLMGDAGAMYTAVIFNPVPGTPMGKNTRLSFRYWLKGEGTLRVQVYSLTRGYHRHLTLTGLPRGSWHRATVDMTAARRPDGSGGPLAEDERIDDIQFYADPAAELLIDDICLYDAAVPGDARPFPKRPLFTAWFDTGRQGKEWPGDFEIVPKKAPLTWKAARSVLNPDLGIPWIRLHLRGGRLLGESTRLRFRYHLSGADSLRVRLRDSAAKEVHAVALKGLKKDEWAEATADFTADSQRGGAGNPRRGDHADEIQFLVPRGAVLLVDDVLLYEP